MTDKNMIINRTGKLKKAMIAANKKEIQQDNLPTGTNIENVYILGDSIVEHKEG